MSVVGLIPARLESERLPRKALLDLDGLPIIVHTLKRAQLSRSLSAVYVCTDSDEITKVVKAYGGRTILTRSDHVNGTERIAEAAKHLAESEHLEFELVVDVQGDQPLLDPNHIDEVVSEHRRQSTWDILVPCTPTAASDSPSVVKIIHDLNHRILAMSRSVIPHPYRGTATCLEHLDSISFRPDALQRLANLMPTPLESVEGVELLRALENGMALGTIVLTGNNCFSVNVAEDYERAKRAMKSDSVRLMY